MKFKVNGLVRIDYDIVDYEIEASSIDDARHLVNEQCKSQKADGIIDSSLTVKLLDELPKIDPCKHCGKMEVNFSATIVLPLEIKYLGLYCSNPSCAVCVKRRIGADNSIEETKLNLIKRWNAKP